MIPQEDQVLHLEAEDQGHVGLGRGGCLVWAASSGFLEEGAGTKARKGEDPESPGKGPAGVLVGRSLEQV